MKKVISLVLAGAMVTAAGITSFADSIIDPTTSRFCYFDVEYDVDPTFTVVIPESISLLDTDVTKQVKIYGENENKNTMLARSDMVFVELSMSENELNVVNENEDSISYTVNGASDLEYPVILAGCRAGEKTTANVVFSKTGKTLYPGTYTDTLTFNVNMASVVDMASLEEDEYYAEDGDVIVGTAGTDTHITVADGAQITLYNCDITNITSDDDHAWGGITLEGNGTVIITGTNTLKGGESHWPAIYVPENKTLTIAGSGSLNAIGQEDSAGIGGGSRNNCGNIEILGGNITSTGGGTSAPGIGSGYGANCGTITISGGNITAEGGLYAAAIGNGYEAACGDITISGGTVNAKAGNYAAAIGTGYHGSSCGNILLSGGSITAIGGTNAAAVGSGQESTCHNITVRSTVTKVEVTKGGNNVPYFGKGGRGTLDGVVTIEDGANVIEH